MCSNIVLDPTDLHCTHIFQNIFFCIPESESPLSQSTVGLLVCRVFNNDRKIQEIKNIYNINTARLDQKVKERT